MFKRVLIANRGEIGVRIVRACRDMDIWSIALYVASDRDSLHVRLADEAVELTSPLGYMDVERIVQIALDAGAEAIHPGYGFLAERAEFARACDEAGIAFIGPPSGVLAILGDRIGAMTRVREAGFATPIHSNRSFNQEEGEELRAEAERLGYPVVIKPVRGGRGRASHLVRSADQLRRAVRQAHAEARVLFAHDSRLYLEKAMLPICFLEVQVVSDTYGNLVHLGERSGSIQRNNQKLIAETPAPCLNDEQRRELQQMALDIARLFNYRNIGTVEFLFEKETGQFYFSEIKARIQVEHPVTEMVSQVNLVREQIEIAYGKRLSVSQEDIYLQGWAIQCRINAEDPWNNFLPSPGHLDRFRLPGGPYVRVDTYGYSGGYVPVRFDSLLAKVIVWGEDRDEAIRRLRRTLQDFAIRGVRTNLAMYQRVLEDPDFIRGEYTTEFLRRSILNTPVETEDLRDLAVAAALAYAIRNQASRPTVPQRLQQGWHRNNRRLG